MRLNKRVYMVASGNDGYALGRNEIDCNVYLVDCGKKTCVLIDAGNGVYSEDICQRIEEYGFKLPDVKAILLTHGHGDHSGGSKNLADICGADVFALEDTARFVSEGDIQSISLDVGLKNEAFGKGYVYKKCFTNPLQDGDVLRFNDLTFETIKTEGHCDGHAAYLVDIDGDRTLFSGDSIFYGGKISLQSIWDCNLEKYVGCIKRLHDVHPEALIPSHWGFSLKRGWIHTDKAFGYLQYQRLPPNILG